MKEKIKTSFMNLIKNKISGIKKTVLTYSANLIKINVDILFIKVIISVVGVSGKKGAYVWDVRIYVFKKLIIGTNLGKSE